MAARRKHVMDLDDELAEMIEQAGLNDDGAVSHSHLRSGLPIYYSETDTPEGAVIKEYPDGRRELVRFDAYGEHLFSPFA